MRKNTKPFSAEGYLRYTIKKKDGIDLVLRRQSKNYKKPSILLSLFMKKSETPFTDYTRMINKYKGIRYVEDDN